MLKKNPSKGGLRGGPANKKQGASRFITDDFFMMDDGSQSVTPQHLTPHGGEGINMNFMQSSLVNKKASGLMGGGPQQH
jgi:hypothetical protein